MSIAHVIIIIKSEVSTFPLLSYFPVVVCLRCLLHHILLFIAYTFRENREFVFIIIVQFMMSANSQIRFDLKIVFACLYITPSHYHHCASLSTYYRLYLSHREANLYTLTSVDNSNQYHMTSITERSIYVKATSTDMILCLNTRWIQSQEVRSISYHMNSIIRNPVCLETTFINTGTSPTKTQTPSRGRYSTYHHMNSTAGRSITLGAYSAEGLL